MRKRSDEEEIISIAISTLLKIYGNYELDKNQTDKPDGALIPKLLPCKLGEKSALRIGLEVTSIDNQEDKRYLNDKSTEKKLSTKQLEEFQATGAYNEHPAKRTTIIIDEKYIINGIAHKKSKYSEYIDSGAFGEIVLLTWSSYALLSKSSISEAHLTWTNFQLSSQSFPFDKVIFVCKETKKAVVVYDKSRPIKSIPVSSAPNNDVTIAKSGFIPIGAKANINDLFEKSPIIENSKKKSAE